MPALTDQRIHCTTTLSRWARCAAAALVAAGLAPGLARAAAPVLNIGSTQQAVSVAVPLPAGQDQEASAWSLVEQGADPIPAQVLPAMGPDGRPADKQGVLAATLRARADAPKTRRFELQPAEAGKKGAGFELRDLNDKSLGLFENGKPVLVYNHGVITGENVPDSDLRKHRACYVHPLYGLQGEVLTDDFPKDHYHHHGLFWAWPHVQIEGQEYDLWAYKNINHRHVAWLAKTAGPEAALVAVENGWFVGDRKVVAERVWLRAHKAAEGRRAIDVTLVVIPLDNPITLWGAPAKSYGGLNLRFGPRAKEDTLITVPEGKTEKDLPETRLTWADFTAKWPEGGKTSGAAIFVHPQHPDYPPTWLTRHYGVLCVGWPGVEPRTFAAGKPIVLNYRVWIHDGPVEPETLREAYAGYQAAVAASWSAGGEASGTPRGVRKHHRLLPRLHRQ